MSTWLGLYVQARPHCEAALTMARSHGDRELEATTVDNLGHLAHNAGRHTLALDHYEQALELYQNQHRADDAARVRRLLDDQSTSSASESCNRPETPSLR